MKTIKIQLNETLLPIYLWPGSIGISVSGGADSAILLYILLKYTTRPIHVFTASLKVKNNSAPRSAFTVIEKCIELTGNSNVYHHIHFIDDMDNRGSLFNGPNYFLKNKLVDVVYTAETIFPSINEFKKFKNQDYFIFNQRDPKNKKPVLSKKFYSPFIQINKKQIRELYEYYNLLDTLYPVTRSCESVHLTTGHCGECLWCEERLWAFGKYQ